MKRIFSFLLVAALMVAMLSVNAASAFAYSPTNPNPKALANCVENIAKQNANGQTGSETGSPNDDKLAPTAVTNCDHFWQ